MFAQVRDARRRDDGFSLIELLVVIIIIGILAAIAVPVFLNQRQKGYSAGVQTDLRNMATAEESYLGTNLSSYGTASQLASTNLVYAISTGDTLAFYISGAQAYCVIGSTVNRSGVWWAYDSVNGGLQDGNFTSNTASSDCPMHDGVTAWSTAGTLQQSGSGLVAS